MVLFPYLQQGPVRDGQPAGNEMRYNFGLFPAVQCSESSLRALGAAGMKAFQFLSCSKDRPETFCLPDNFGLFPQFMFHLRRSNLLQVGNLSVLSASF